MSTKGQRKPDCFIIGDVFRVPEIHSHWGSPSAVYKNHQRNTMHSVFLHNLIEVPDPEIKVGSRVKFIPPHGKDGIFPHLISGDVFTVLKTMRFKESSESEISACYKEDVSGNVEYYVPVKYLELIKEEPIIKEGSKVRVIEDYPQSYTTVSDDYLKMHPHNKLKKGEVFEVIEVKGDRQVAIYASASGSLNSVPLKHIELFSEATASPSKEIIIQESKYKAGDYVRYLGTSQESSTSFFRYISSEAFSKSMKKGEVFQVREVELDSADHSLDKLRYWFGGFTGGETWIHARHVEPAVKPSAVDITPLVASTLTIIGGIQMNQFFSDPVIHAYINGLTAVASVVTSYILILKGVGQTTGNALARWSDRRRRLNKEAQETTIAALVKSIKEGKV